MTSFPGARWWKVDVHSHSPASVDYGKGSTDQAAERAVSPRDWLLGAMRAGLDAVVITDHNSGAWIDPLKQALAALATEAPAGYRPLVLFPGVEITANGGAHILAVFSDSAGTSEVTRLLGSVDARTRPGESDPAATKSPIEVVQAILAAGAIPILAHVDAANSAFSAPGNSLGPLLEVDGLDAMEVCRLDWSPPEVYRQRPLASRVLGSDSHHRSGAAGQRFPGSHFTWVKMESPTLDGLRLALLDGDEVSIRRSDVVSEDQNQHAHLVIEAITVTDARYCGRGAPLVAPLSPWLTTIIGGRGTGKSTLVQLLRLALRREDDLPEALRPDLDAFRTVSTSRGTTGALTDSTAVQVDVRKDGQRFRVHWSTSGALPVIEEHRSGAWVPASGEVRSRFPVRIFGQGQIFEMARDGRALLKIIDDAPEVERAPWKAEWDREELRFLSLRAKARELDKQIAERPLIEGALSDVCRKLAVFEEASHADVLRAYQRSQRQRRELDAWEEALRELETSLRTVADRLKPIDLDAGAFDSEVAAEVAILEQVDADRLAVAELARQTAALADQLRERAAAWARVKGGSPWRRTAESVEAGYRALVAELSDRGVTDVSQYGPLVQQRRLLEEQLRALAGLVVTREELRGEIEASLRGLSTLRQRLTARRTAFLDQVLRENPHVRMAIEPYGRDARGAELTLRGVLAIRDGKYSDDILSEDGTRGCLAAVYRDLPLDRPARAAELERRIAECKERLIAVASGGEAGVGGWFARHLRQLGPESLDRLQCWFPPDGLAVSYSPRGDGRGFRALEQGSPGQKTAAILAFLLAHGTEPIVLDQPEDDLDNELIYELIVAQLRANKRRRQVIVVTHNPNIVVNGDAELILVMESASGQCRLNHQGSLQSRSIRAQVCKVMEGGREALKSRYRRVLAGADDV